MKSYALKTDRIKGTVHRACDAARTDMSDDIELFYNTVRDQ
ncbi:hypothetical protein [Mesorhizobium sp. BR1-1-16]|nr:hypothetical protein [Mesorhizobium sp. BR1-1-16]